MGFTRRAFMALASGAVFGLAGCATQGEQQSSVSQEQSSSSAQPMPDVDVHKFDRLALDTRDWKYDEENDVYYQLALPYCLDPAAPSCESLAIFVPGAYFLAEKAGRSTFSCTVNKEAKVGNFTPATAPIVMPINSGTLGAQTCPTSYSYAGLGNYLSAGCIYVYAGFRGRSSGYESGTDDVYAGGDPWPVVDLKAAVRYLRYNATFIPGNTDRIFTFGFSAGGGVSTVVGASGDSELFTPYLDQIGAAEYDAQGVYLSDAVFGSASWCPITSFDTADASYEWMMGQYAATGTRAEGTWTKLLSNDLARRYAAYVNEMGFLGEQDQQLSLDETTGELYTDGTYYTYLVDCIEKAATDFFANTQFPYTFTPQHLVNANFPGDPSLQSVGAGTPDVEAVTGDASAQASGVMGSEAGAEGTTEVKSTVYNTEDDYVNALNGDAWWLTYNQRRGTVRISSLGDFVRHMKVAAKDVCAFDAIDRSTIVNQLFGVNEDGGLHFSDMLHDQLAKGQDEYAKGDGWRAALVGEWADDLAEVDVLETTMATRMNMFNPLFFLSGYYTGHGTSEIAPHWRINSGLFQTDTSLCTEVNLALALRHNDGVADVAFTPVWGQGHVLAEVNGAPESNLVAWIESCCQQA